MNDDKYSYIYKNGITLFSFVSGSSSLSWSNRCFTVVKDDMVRVLISNSSYSSFYSNVSGTISVIDTEYKAFSSF